jgi:hemolysin activation/secretion protein
MKLTHIAAACAAAVLTCATYAQVVVPPSADPGALQQRRIDEEQRRLEQERLDRKATDAPVSQEATKPVAPAAADALKFMVREIQFAPASEVFSAEELRALAKEVEGKEVSFADLQLLAERINAAYREKGVVTARAVIRPQDVSSGVIKLQLVEGKLGGISVMGNASTRESYILNRVQAEPGQLVDLPILQASLSQFNRTNSAQLRAALKPGQSFGSTDLIIDVTEPQNNSFRLGVDNLGSEVTGRTRVGVAYANQSLLGWRDTLSLAAMSASGLKSYSFDYGVPINRSGGRLNLAYNDDATKLKFGPFASLGITGKSTSAALSLRQPVYFGERSKLDVLAGVRKRDAENKVSGIFLSSTASDDVHLGLEYQSADDAGQWLTNYTLYNGSATTADVKAKYTVGRGSLRRTQFLSSGWALRGALSVQHTSSDALPSSEQFFLGGEGSVRGYTVGAVSGDQGATFSLELHHPITGQGAGAEGQFFAANGFFFLDAGHVKLILPPESILAKSETLTSLGWGANMFMGKNVSALVTLAYALKKLPNEPRQYTVSFQLNSQF